MKDLYKVLGLSHTASAKEIKAAYKKCALESHPDKGGSSERMALINEAYTTLSDPTKRQVFDISWSVSEEPESEIRYDLKSLEMGDYVPYSYAYRIEHRGLVNQFFQTPLERRTVFEYFKPFESNLYSFDSKEGEPLKNFNSIFKLIREKKLSRVRTTNSQQLKINYKPMALARSFISYLLSYSDSTKPVQKDTVPKFSQDPLTPTFAIKLFTEFLSGELDYDKLKPVKQYLSDEIIISRDKNSAAPELLLYEGIFEILSITDLENDDGIYKQIFSIQKIVDFARDSSDDMFKSMVPLFNNPFFRNLFASAIHQYWQSNEDLFTNEKLSLYDGRLIAKDIFKVLANRLSNSDQDDPTVNFIRYIKLLFNLDKTIDHQNNFEHQATYYRDKAFLLLDWIPALLDLTPKKVLINIFLQIGIKFQQASQNEIEPKIKMADEKLALKMYLTCFSLGHENGTPDIEIYTNLEILKYISKFFFKDTILSELIPA
ncbi:MAG: J domain-containing protein, partial [Legionella sp.]|nr:J domain-containing protein [Legionella sp.]